MRNRISIGQVTAFCHRIDCAARPDRCQLVPRAARPSSRRSNSELESQRRLLADWAGLIRYGSANAELPKLKATEQRLSLSATRSLCAGARCKNGVFSNPSYINRGIAGQTTPQTLVRFRPGCDQAPAEGGSHPRGHERHRQLSGAESPPR
jgi:hypothetical protein